MAIDVYSLPAVAQARAALDKYRGKVEYGVGKMQVLAEIGGSSYLVARISAQLGGPEGKAILGVPIELAIGAACGALAMSGSAGKHSEDVLAAGVGAIAAYTARLGFEAGLAHARPPAEAQQPNQVSGVMPYYYLPPPPPRMMLPSPMQVPYGASQYQQYVDRAADVGADVIDSAVEVLDRMNRG